ncbi:hypothetical protein JQ615_41130 [Bradyrhizobium jicamae]|uniref:Uncharacterized protein n=1 Tax=Bradyrhizobium jicamae TaxID=280332 RepID=A0ABS5FY89_9BRAD|nr:hypothetical protein [Bradyrhizobium jicamae]MBR0801747.1 hypothetical protein [Bradyrhizobium jicamae]
MNFSELWLGLGCESGGEIVGGLAQQQGVLFSYGDLLKTPARVRSCSIDQRSATVGVGLGGAVSMNFLIGVNAPHAQFFGHPMDWGADFSVDLGLSGLAHYVRSLPEMIELAAIAKNFNGAGLKAAEVLTKYEANRRMIKDAFEGSSLRRWTIARISFRSRCLARAGGSGYRSRPNGKALS